MDTKVTSLIRLTNNIYRVTQAYLDKELEKFDLTTGTYPYLMKLKHKPGISQNEISRELNVDKAMSARSIKKLIELGYIRKEENSEDVRAYKLYITKKAEEVIPKVVEILKGWTEILIKGNSEETINTSIDFLESVLENGKNYRRIKHCEEVKEE